MACDIGFGRSICIEYDCMGVQFNTYNTLPHGITTKVKAKCVDLSLKAWKKINDNLESITLAFEKLRIDVTDPVAKIDLQLDKHIYLNITPNVACVNIRHYFFNTKTKSLCPGLPGIGLRCAEFEELLKMIPEMNELVCTQDVDDE
jgi:hypothetical protein